MRVRTLVPRVLAVNAFTSTRLQWQRLPTHTLRSTRSVTRVARLGLTFTVAVLWATVAENVTSRGDSRTGGAPAPPAGGVFGALCGEGAPAGSGAGVGDGGGAGTQPSGVLAGTVGHWSTTS